MTLEDARALDSADPIRSARDRFALPGDIIYLDGNSLGALPRATPARIAEVVERQWGGDLIAGWNRHGWIDAPFRIAARLAPLLGARENELLIADSTSVGLFKLLGAAGAARPGRTAILTQAGEFPTDAYVAQGLAKLLGTVAVREVAREDVSGAIDGDTAAVLLTHVDYRSGAKHDMAAINAAARAAGALSIWDLSHSAGAVALDLAGEGCDLAVGCSYKYLNGGPGAPAFLFVAEALQGELSSPIAGWMGHADPFAFAADYRPAEGIARFLTGTPPILALAALEAGLESFAGLAMADIEAKSRRLSEVFVAEVEARCGDRVRLASPRRPGLRGSHVSFAHPHGYTVIQALIARGIIGDFRPPDLMRFAFAPLYTRFEDVWRAAESLGQLINTGAWDRPEFHRRARVT